MRPSPRVNPDEWAQKNRIYPETAGIPGPRNPYITPYILRFNRVLHNGEDEDGRVYSQAGFVCGAQMGKTDGELDVIGARLDQKPSPILFVGPTKDIVSDMFEPRIMELLDQSEALSGKVMRGKKMRKLIKWIAGVKLRLAFGGSSSQLKSDPAGLAIIDEFDEMMANVKGQGSVLGLVDARGGTYADFMLGVSSTPSIGKVEIVSQDNQTIEGGGMSVLEFWKISATDDLESPIWVFWQSGTRHHWAWPCFHCHEFFIPRFKMLRYPKEATPQEARLNTCIDCPHCGGELLYDEHLDWMNAHADYVAPGETIRLEGESVVIHGEPLQTNRWTGWASGLASPFVTWGERVEKYLNGVLTGDANEVQTAINAQMGELYAPGMGGDKPDWEQIYQKRSAYKTGEIPKEVLTIVAGVDVQKTSLYYVVRGFGSRGASWLLDYGQIFGATDTDDPWMALTDLITSPVGDEMYIQRVLIDSGFRPDKPDAGDEHRVYSYCRDMSWIAKPTKGRQVQASPYRISKTEVNSRGSTKKVSLELVILNTDFFKTMVYSRINTPHKQGGAFFLPGDVSEDYCRQITSEARTIENGKPSWVQTSKNNHYLDCEALAAAAGYSLNVHRIPEGVSREVKENEKAADKPKPNDARDNSQDQAAANPLSDGASLRAGGGSFKDKWAAKGSKWK